MPRYDYRCTECSHNFEVSRPLGHGPDEVCPECESDAKRVFTPVGVVFKGSGFHNTDYRDTPSTSPSSESAPAKTTSPSPPCGTDCSSCPAAKS